MKKIIGIIPARYASTRFPGKPLVDIAGKTMIERVYRQALACRDLSQVIVATDDERIAREVERFGGEYCMTSSEHPSGTDRCAEVIKNLKSDCDAVINIQGDEPFIDPNQISLLCSCFDDERTEIATLIRKLDDAGKLFSPNTVKVVCDANAFAIYFSRNPIPFVRSVDQSQWMTAQDFYQHIGIYGYRKSALEKITQLPQGKLERAESLEQLRWIEHGYAIKTAITNRDTVAIDTPDDLVRLNEAIARGQHL